MIILKHTCRDKMDTKPAYIDFIRNILIFPKLSQISIITCLVHFIIKENL